MNNKPLITLFEENELNIAALYSLYAQQFPEQQKFWDKLSNEEIGHAAQIGTQRSNEGAIAENKFSSSVIHYLMDYVLTETQKAQQEKLTHHSALLTALRIEQSMLEKKCFDLFTPTNETVKAVFDRLNRDTQQHVEALLREMKKNKFSFEEVAEQ